MPLFSFTFDGTTYSLDLDFDDAALMDNKMAVELTALRRKDGREDSVRVRVEILPWDNIGRIEAPGIGSIEFQLTDHGGAIEQFIQRIPVPDPILGCALKAGISALIGQAIACRREVESTGLWKKMEAFVACMRRHLGNISRTALRRAFGCMLSAGLL